MSVDPHTNSYWCRHIKADERPILYVSRPEGDWCVMCGGADHAQDASDWFVIGLGHVTDRDPSVAEVLDLEANEEAERAATGEPWVRRKFEPDAP